MLFRSGQALKRIAPPFIPERMDYYRIEQPGQAQSIPSGPMHLTFRWNGSLRDGVTCFSNEPYPVSSMISNALGINRGRFEGPASVLDAPIPGDWIVRESSSTAERMRAFAEILRTEMAIPVHVDQRRERRLAVLITGSYRFEPIPDAPWDPASIHLG